MQNSDTEVGGLYECECGRVTELAGGECRDCEFGGRL